MDMSGWVGGPPDSSNKFWDVRPRTPCTPLYLKYCIFFAYYIEFIEYKQERKELGAGLEAGRCPNVINGVVVMSNASAVSPALGLTL